MITRRTFQPRALGEIAIRCADIGAMAAFYEDVIGQPYRVEHFGWVGWRGIFTDDPEGNTVELVAFDPSEMTG